ncbi:MAG TPA: hypothetical protein VFD84_17725 [Candidatus Binatia bacterium]|jgi:hypothetical protein|nr:hypothetical protein [Candidatus Binatia bacterium]
MPKTRARRVAPGPGPVAAVHRLLIATALACAVFFAVWELREWRRTGAAEAAVVTAVAAAAATGIGLYLRSLRRRLNAKLTPRRTPD